MYPTQKVRAGEMETMRKSVAAWQLLQRMNQTEVGVIFNADTGRPHFIQHCRVMDPVDNRSLDLLTRQGFVRRERSAIPVYVIADKGRDALQHRDAPDELAEVESASMPARSCKTCELGPCRDYKIICLECDNATWNQVEQIRK